MTKLLSKSQLLSTCQPKRVKVELPNDEGHVFVRQWRLREADEITNTSNRFQEDGLDADARQKLDAEWRKLIVLYSLCDGKGEPHFDDSDIDGYLDLPHSVVRPIIRQALLLNGMNKALVDFLAPADDTSDEPVSLEKAEDAPEEAKGDQSPN